MNFDNNPKALEALQIARHTKDSLFLTGKAGTGKSTLLRYLVNDLSKKYVILAPTGIAALNVGGQTIHSFFQFEPRPYLPNDPDVKALTSEKKALFEKIDLIVIDEVSMVRADLLTAIDLSLRLNTGSKEPFGGKQMLFIGDLFQLPPVVDSKNVEEVEIIGQNYKTPFFFSAKSFEVPNFKYHTVELEKIYRQQDDKFIELLNNVRIKKIQQTDLDYLNKRYTENFIPKPDSFSIILATTNATVNLTNQERINAVDTELYEFIAETTGSFNAKDSKAKLPTDKFLKLKVGAQVMMIKNDGDKRWVNGSIGKIATIDKDGISIKIKNSENIHTIERVIWEDCEYVWNRKEHKIEKKIIGTFTQYPLKLAWAVTIHKSQGQTFEDVVVDLGTGAFAAGQTYVALSRCTTFEGIVMKQKAKISDIMVDERVKNFLDGSNVAEKAKVKEKAIMNGLSQSVQDLEKEKEAVARKLKIEEELTISVKKEKENISDKLVEEKKLSAYIQKEQEQVKRELNKVRDELRQTEEELTKYKINVVRNTDANKYLQTELRQTEEELAKHKIDLVKNMDTNKYLQVEVKYLQIEVKNLKMELKTWIIIFKIMLLLLVAAIMYIMNSF